MLRQYPNSRPFGANSYRATHDSYTKNSSVRSIKKPPLLTDLKKKTPNLIIIKRQTYKTTGSPPAEQRNFLGKIYGLFCLRINFSMPQGPWNGVALGL